MNPFRSVTVIRRWFAHLSPKQLLHPTVRSSRLNLENLEDRAVPATITVTALGDPIGPHTGVTLRDAIEASETHSSINGSVAGTGTDTIVFASSLGGQTIFLSQNDSDDSFGATGLVITDSISIDGGSSGITIDGGSDRRLFGEVNGASLSLTNLTLTDGQALGADGGGGAVFNDGGSLYVLGCTFLNNSAQGGANGVDFGGGDGMGGAIFNNGGSTTIINSTFTANTASSGSNASTGDGLGGAIFSRNGLLNLQLDTISGNTATGGGRGVYILADGTTAQVEIVDTIIGQTDASVTDIDATTNGPGASLNISGDHNLIRDPGSTIPMSLDFSTQDPLLNGLASNGGPTQTMSLQNGSPSLNHGTGFVTYDHVVFGQPYVPPPQFFDQRGLSREEGTQYDIGAFQAQVQITISGGNNQSTSINSPFSSPLTVTVTSPDLGGAPVVGLAVMFIFPSANGASATSSALGFTPGLYGSSGTVIVKTDANGQASIDVVANSTPGTYTVFASLEESRVSFTLTNTPIPTSNVAALPATEPTKTFNVSWSGQEPIGPGIANYSLYVSDDGGSYQPLLQDTTATSTNFTGQDGHTYSFYSVATDDSGAVQTTPGSAQSTTTIKLPVYPAYSLIGVSASTIQLDGSTTVTLQAIDPDGNAETTGGLVVSFALENNTGARGTFSKITDHHNGTYTAIFTGTLDGNNSIIATVNGLAVINTTPISVEGGAVSLTESTVTVPPSPIEAGTTTTVTLQAVYPKNQPEPAGGLTVAFKLGNSTGGQGTFSAVKDLGDGQYTTVFTGTLAGKNTILAYINGQLISSTPSITVVPGSLSLMKSPVTISSTIMKAGGTVTVTLQPEDAGGNKLNLEPGQTVAFSIASGLGTFGPVTANKNGTYSATFTTNTAGSYDIETSINNQAVTSTILVLNVLPATVSLTNSAVNVSMESVQSGNQITVTLKAVDAFGNLEAAGLTVAFLLGGGSGKGTFGNVTYTGNGIYQATFTATNSGSTVIEALIDGFKVKSTASITVMPAT